VSARLQLGQVAPGPGDDHPVDQQPLHRRRQHRQLGPQRVHPQIPSRLWTTRLVCGGLTSVSEVSTFAINHAESDVAVVGDLTQRGIAANRLDDLPTLLLGLGFLALVVSACRVSDSLAAGGDSRVLTLTP
jgi:hypothetical protein